MKTTFLLTLAALIAFAANSLLARAALGGHGIDAASFTAIRLASGAAVMVVLFRVQGGSVALLPGSWATAASLLVYALAFSFAYLRLGAAVGALILFGAVQTSMLLWGVLRRDRPTSAELVGLAIAFSALVYLLLPGLDTPDLWGSVLMISAGVAWGVYSIRGRVAGDPIGQTAGNFVRAAGVAVPLALLLAASSEVTTQGVVLALVSGTITSALGYVLWYRALPRLSTTQAATVQLTVPIIAAVGAVLFLSEALTWRLVAASLCLLGGVALAVCARLPRRV
jgi:drug/metabolite transporter (DMT)-like permease